MRIGYATPFVESSRLLEAVLTHAAQGAFKVLRYLAPWRSRRDTALGIPCALVVLPTANGANIFHNTSPFVFSCVLLLHQPAVHRHGDHLPRDELPALLECLFRRQLQPAAAGHLHADDGDALDVVAADDLRQLFGIVHAVQLGTAHHIRTIIYRDSRSRIQLHHPFQ